MAYDRAGNLSNLEVQYANGLQMNQEYRVNMHNQVAEVITTVRNAFEEEAQEEEWKINFGYDEEGRVQSVSAHPREAHVQYGDSGAVSRIVVDGNEVWSENVQDSMGSSLLDARNGATARVIAPWWTSHIYSDLERIVYNRPVKSDYWGVWYDGDVSQSLNYDIDFDSKERINSATKDRLMLVKATRQPPLMFEFDKPSNSLFLPPEYASINCQMCTSYLAGIRVSGTSHVILDGDDGDISRDELAKYTTRATVHCGLDDDPGTPSVGVQSIVHRIDYGDGHFDQKVETAGSVGRVSRTEANFRHIYVTPSLYIVSATAWCSGCSFLPLLPPIDNEYEHTLAECATPDEFEWVRDTENDPLGNFTARYKFGSSSKLGKMSDFRNCRVRECVRYEEETLCNSPVTPYYWPSPPWEDDVWVNNPTIVPQTITEQIAKAKSGKLLDKHESRLERSDLVDPDEYEEASFVGDQFYQMYCPCQRTRTWSPIPSVDGSSINVIERRVVERDQEGYWYEIYKHGELKREKKLPGQRN